MCVECNAFSVTHMRPDQTPAPTSLTLEAFRTLLASERTLLSYIRTSIAMLVAGATVLQFFDDKYIRLIGWGLLPGSVFLGFWGWRRYARIRDALNRGETPPF